MQWCVFVLYAQAAISHVITMDSFTAAVYEHDVIYPRNRTIVSRGTAVNDMMKNLDYYWMETIQAKKRNASLIVFPEYGLYGLGWSRETITPYLEYIPDPNVTSWNPCNSPARFTNVDVQILLSCLAKYYLVFIVANIGARQPCNSSSQHCPKDGAYQFSTNVVYNNKGNFVARYFKYNLQVGEEDYFDKPEKVNLTTFDTPFGRFGTFTSSDILYKEPAYTLIKKMNVTNIAYPTAWKEKLPLMSAIEFHSAFAEGMLVNLLAANLHIPNLGYYGSGLYWPTGTSIDGRYAYEDSTSSLGQLVVGDVAPFRPIPRSFLSREEFKLPRLSLIKKINLPDKKYKLTINGDVYTALVLKHMEDFYEPKVCQGQICCEGAIEGTFPKTDIFAFGAFDGYHGSGDQRYYLQACIFVKCANSSIESCGQPTKSSASYIDKMSFVANFTSSGIVFPEVLTSSGGEMELVTRIWYYQGSIIIDAGIYGAPISVAMLNRVYTRD